MTAPVTTLATRPVGTVRTDTPRTLVDVVMKLNQRSHIFSLFVLIEHQAEAQSDEQDAHGLIKAPPKSFPPLQPLTDGAGKIPQQTKDQDRLHGKQ